MVEKKSLQYSINKPLWDNLYPYLEAENACIVCGNTQFTVWAKSAKADEQKVLDKYHSAKTKGAKRK